MVNQILSVLVTLFYFSELTNILAFFFTKTKLEWRVKYVQPTLRDKLAPFMHLSLQTTTVSLSVACRWPVDWQV